MLALERRQDIIRILKKEKSVKVTNLSNRYNVTEETIRRDLEKLEKEGIATRTYGGAILDKNVSDDPPLLVRSKENTANKQSIAKIASNFVKDGDTIFLDSSTTALEVVKAIKTNISVTIITNSMHAMNIIGKNKKINIIGVGGQLNTKTLAFEGPSTVRFIDNYYADKAIFSCKGITKERGIMDTKELTAEVKARMIHNANQTILVIDKSKFDREAFIGIADLSLINTIVTDYQFDEEWLAVLDDNKVQIVQADE